MVLIAEISILKAGLEFLLDIKPRVKGNKHQVYLLSNNIYSS